MVRLWLVLRVVLEVGLAQLLGIELALRGCVHLTAIGLDQMVAAITGGRDTISKVQFQVVIDDVTSNSGTRPRTNRAVIHLPQRGLGNFLNGNGEPHTLDLVVLFGLAHINPFNLLDFVGALLGFDLPQELASGVNVEIVVGRVGVVDFAVRTIGVRGVDFAVLAQVGIGLDHVLKMLEDVPLDGGVQLDVLADFGVDLIPGASDLAVEVALEGSEVLVKLLAVVAVGLAHSLLLGQVFVLVFLGAGHASVLTANAGPFHDHLRHVGTHNSSLRIFISWHLRNYQRTHRKLVSTSCFLFVELFGTNDLFLENVSVNVLVGR